MPTVTLDTREKKKRGQFLAAWPLMAIGLVSCGSVDSFKIAKGAESQVCEDVRNAIRHINPPRPASPGICRWYAQLDTLSTDSVQSPKWRPFTPSEELVRDMRLVGYSYFKHADKNTLADIWREKFQSQWREAMRKGEYRYEQSMFDIDDDGKTERVVREVHVGCSNELLWPATPRMYVLTDQGIDDRYGPSGTNVSSAIIVRNKTFAVVVDSVPDPSPKNAAGQYPPPRLEVNLYRPRPPSQLAPFMLNGPICSFELSHSRSSDICLRVRNLAMSGELKSYAVEFTEKEIGTLDYTFDIDTDSSMDSLTSQCGYSSDAECEFTLEIARGGANLF